MDKYTERGKRWRGNLEEWFVVEMLDTGSRCWILDARCWMLVTASARFFNIPISEYLNISISHHEAIRKNKGRLSIISTSALEKCLTIYLNLN